MTSRFFLLIALLFFGRNLHAQVLRIAITDFENTSGIVKYNGLGKALGSMLISDIESNVSPKRIQFVERSQINKILSEQSFQKTPNVDLNTAVNFGKIDLYVCKQVLFPEILYGMAEIIAAGIDYFIPYI